MQRKHRLVCPRRVEHLARSTQMPSDSSWAGRTQGTRGIQRHQEAEAEEREEGEMQAAIFYLSSQFGLMRSAAPELLTEFLMFGGKGATTLGSHSSVRHGFVLLRFLARLAKCSVGHEPRESDRSPSWLGLCSPPSVQVATEEISALSGFERL